MKFKVLFILLLLSGFISAAKLPDIPYTKIKLDNGLTLIVHEDHKAPIVAVNVWYAVGSRDEVVGKTGFAHLFEHLMFNGSENHDKDYFIPLNDVGVTNINGTTNSDRTNYFQTVPKDALDLVLWLESDRMGHLLGAITQDKLDEQRGVVKNEKRQRENTPYGKVWGHIAKNTYPPGHPYSWQVIGSMADLDDATLEDVHDWFKKHYGPNNATLVIAGDITVEEARKKVEHYFGHIPPNKSERRLKAWIAPMNGTRTDVMYDDVPHARTYWVWNVPPLDTPDGQVMGLIAGSLAGGPNSRLYRKLVERKLATDVGAFYYGRQLSGQLWIYADATKPKYLKRIKLEIIREILYLAQRGMNSRELARLQPSFEAEIIRGLEHLGGFGGKSDVLASSEVYRGDPGAWQKAALKVLEADLPSLHKTLKKWLNNNYYMLDVLPLNKYKPGKSAADRSKQPSLNKPEPFDIPSLQRFKLPNGVPVTMIQRSGSPTFEIKFQFSAGHAADAKGEEGVGDFATHMLTQGGGSLNKFAMDEQLTKLGAQVNGSTTVDTSSLMVSGLSKNVSATLKLVGTMLTSPRFDSSEIEIRRSQVLASIAQESASPNSIGLRTLPPLLFGEGHPYAIPFTGTGYAAAVKKLTRGQLQAFRNKWLKPSKLHIIAVGDVDSKTLLNALNGAMRAWKSKLVAAQSVTKPVVRPDARVLEKSRVYLVDRPGAQQSYIFAGKLLPNLSGKSEDAMVAANSIIGGNFTSRLNMNLREDKHWSYGARSSMIPTQGQYMIWISAPVQTDATIPALKEIKKEFGQFSSKVQPPTSDELQNHQKNRIWRVPGKYELNSNLLYDLSQQIRLYRPDDYLSTQIQRVQALSLQNIRDAAQKYLKPDPLVWVIVGDISVIGEEVKKLNLGKTETLEQSL